MSRTTQQPGTLADADRIRKAIHQHLRDQDRYCFVELSPTRRQLIAHKALGSIDRWQEVPRIVDWRDFICHQ